MRILGIETSCDETAAAVIEDGTHVVSNVVISQIDIHKAYGGVVPEVAARSHIEAILPVIDQAVDNWDEIDAIAVANRPGLLGSLLIGTLTARTLALLRHKPLYGINHLKAHVYANWLESGNAGTPTFPAICLLVSGGHTQILYLKSHTDFEIIGTTRDDAVGEAFDKVAKILGLPYPGGPSISKAAEQATRTFPLPTPHVDGLDFSFSGLKTAVLRAIQNHLGVPISTPSSELASLLTEADRNAFAASFQNTAVNYLVDKLSQAIDQYRPKSVLLAGGVSANKLLRIRANELVEQINSKACGTCERRAHKQAHPVTTGVSEAVPQDLKLFVPQPKFSTDNAAMVASAAFFEIDNGRQPDNPHSLETNPTK